MNNMFGGWGTGMNMINGLAYFESTAAGTTEEYLTRKQTRKFKNRRWNKKYKKKYTATRFIPGAVMDKIRNVLYIHPVVLAEMKKEM